MPFQVLKLHGEYTSSCGYCSEEPGKRSEKRGSRSYAASPATLLSCSVYMEMLDRGWRRSGTFLYKPNMKRTCCPQYTIKLDAMEFQPTRSQRQIVNRWNRYILKDNQTDGKTQGNMSNRASGKSTPPFELIRDIHASEGSFLLDGAKPAHVFEVTLERSEFTEERFELYKKYQRDVHHEEDKRSWNFKHFLVDSPLIEETIPYSRPRPLHLPEFYGAYHQCYRIDGELFAVGVLDILPGCVSSVYFMYDKRWERFSPGKLSALRESALAREMNEAGAPTVHSLYMGFYVHTCPKMKYKGDYSPSYLLDPEEYTWHPLKTCTELLSKHRYVCFVRPDESYFDEDPGPEKVSEIPSQELKSVFWLDQGMTMSITESPAWSDDDSKETILLGIMNLGLEISRKIVFLT